MTAEPSTLDLSQRQSVREIRIANESDIIATIEIEYRGGGWWRGTCDDGGDPRERQTYASRRLSEVQYWAVGAMDWQERKAIDACAKICGTDGEDTTGNGTFACGAMSPHGIHSTLYNRDGDDITQDYLINGV